MRIARRDALSLLLAGAARAAGLDRFFESAQGAAVLVDIRTRRVIASHGAGAAAAELAPPGSTVKPLVLAALLRSGKLGADESFPCPARLSIGGRQLNCSHPPLPLPVRARTALAYSCNCFVAHFAARFGAGELASHLERAGLTALPGLLGADEVAGRVRVVRDVAGTQLQALGEDHVLVTTAALAMAYRGLALSAARPEMQPVVAGLEDAVEFGTARLASVAKCKVAGKTGSVLAEGGAHIAWFAGFAPSRAPEVAVTVMLQGRSGGGDAAPVAGRILEAYFAGQLA